MSSKWRYNESDDYSDDGFEKFADKSKQRISEDWEDARRLERKKLRKKKRRAEEDEDDDERD